MVVGDDGLYRNLHEFEIDGMFEFCKLVKLIVVDLHTETI